MMRVPMGCLLPTSVTSLTISLTGLLWNRYSVSWERESGVTASLIVKVNPDRSIVKQIQCLMREGKWSDTLTDFEGKSWQIHCQTDTVSWQREGGVTPSLIVKVSPERSTVKQIQCLLGEGKWWSDTLPDCVGKSQQIHCQTDIVC